MNTTPSMDAQIVGILRISDRPECQYAAQRIEELERENLDLIHDYAQVEYLLRELLSMAWVVEQIPYRIITKARALLGMEGE